MKRFFISFFAVTCCMTVFSQTVTWSPDAIDPKQKNLFTGLGFAGVDANNYYVSEFDGGGVSANRKYKMYFHSIDKNSLKQVKEINLEANTDDGEYINSRNFLMNNIQYSFFLGEGKKDEYGIFATSNKLDGTVHSAFAELHKINASKSRPFASGASPLANKLSKNYAAMLAMPYVQVQAAYDNKSIISAFVYETVDNGYSMINVSEWDDKLKSISSNNYKIPFYAKQRKQKTIFGAMGTSGGEFPYVLDLAKGTDGFMYVLVQSPDPKNDDDASLYWLYQFKPNDPAYTKVFRKEICRNMSSAQASLYQDISGKIYISSVGKEIEKDKDKDETDLINAAFIGSINNGQLETIFAGTLAPEMMYNFESEKTVDKKGAVNTLRVKNILPASNGSCYVVWEHSWEDEKFKSDGSTTSTQYLGNTLVQFYAGKKLAWQKPVLKVQAQKDDRIQSIYAGITCGLANGKLYIIYPDDPKNATKDITDPKVATFSVIKFGNKDLAGMFVANFDEKGNYTRAYINWPDNRIGFALCLNSLKKISDNEYIGTVRKISQGAITLKSEEFSFFRLKL